MKILLICCSSSPDILPCESLELGYLAATLLQAGHAASYVKQIRGGRYQRARDLLDEVLRQKPDLVGFTSHYYNQHNSEQLAHAIKQRMDCSVVFGGYYPSVHPELALQRFVDYVVVGEGERTLGQLVEHLSTGSPLLEEIAGLAYADGQRLAFGGPQIRIEDLDSLPRPLRPLDLGYGAQRSPDPLPFPIAPPAGFLLLGSRGCPFHCEYCLGGSIWGGRRIARSPQNIIDEIVDLRSRGAGGLFFLDADLFYDRVRASDLFRAMTGLGVAWLAFGVIASLDAELLDLAAAAGCRMLSIGYETASQRTMKHLGKPYEVSRAIEITREAQLRGIRIWGTFMIGFPEEDLSTIRQTAHFARVLRPEVIHLGYVRPFKGTRFYENALSRGLISDQDEVRRNLLPVWPSVPTQHLSRPVLFLAMVWAQLFIHLHLRLAPALRRLCSMLQAPQSAPPDPLGLK